MQMYIVYINMKTKFLLPNEMRWMFLAKVSVDNRTNTFAHRESIHMIYAHG